MTDQRSQAEIVRQSLKRRYRKERRFRLYGMTAIAIALLSLVVLFTDIIGKGYTGFIKTTMTLEVVLDGEQMYLDDASDKDQMSMADFQAPIITALQKHFPEVEERKDLRELSRLAGSYASNQIKDLLARQPELLGTTQTMEFLVRHGVGLCETCRQSRHSIRLSEQQQRWVDELVQKGVVDTGFNDVFFSRGDFREPSNAGILGAIVGSLLTMVVTLVIAFPMGVAAAVYWRNSRPRTSSPILSRSTSTTWRRYCRSSSVCWAWRCLSGCSVAALAGIGWPGAGADDPAHHHFQPAAIKSVPPSIREAAEGIGASKMQVVLHHVVPLPCPA